MTPRVALTLGDPRGIGPEIARAALVDAPAAEWVVLGPAIQLEGLPGTHVVQRAACSVPGTWSVAEAGQQVRLQVEEAVRLALAGDLDAIVTGPAEKAALHAAGVPYPGHTEWLGALAGGVATAMMLAVDRLRVVLLTTHVALRAVPDLLSVDLITRLASITRGALIERFGVAEPRLALCALNPHGGEGGAFGDEDERILAPAAAALGVAGPFPADTVFVRALGGEFDAVLAPYHDVGMTAVKVAGFGRGVNVTLGLPFIRTAPDHGTAIDIVGTGQADAGSLRAAMRMAVELGV